MVTVDGVPVREVFEDYGGVAVEGVRNLCNPPAGWAIQVKTVVPYGKRDRIIGTEQNFFMHLFLFGEVAQGPGAEWNQDCGDIGVEILVLGQHRQQFEIVAVEVTWRFAQVTPGTNSVFESAQPHMGGDHSHPASQREIKHLGAFIAWLGLDGVFAADMDDQRQFMLLQFFVVGDQVFTVQIDTPVVLQKLGAAAAFLRIFIEQIEGARPHWVDRQKRDEAVRIFSGNGQHILAHGAHGFVPIDFSALFIETGIDTKQAGLFHGVGFFDRLGHGFDIGLVGLLFQGAWFDPQSAGKEMYGDSVERPIEGNLRVEQMGVYIDRSHYSSLPCESVIDEVSLAERIVQRSRAGVQSMDSSTR